MSGHTKLGLALVLVFVFFLLALAAELLYILWYRRRFALAAAGVDDRELAATTVESEPGASTKSKELLLYLLCWKNQSRIEPTPVSVSPIYSVHAVTPGFPHPGSDAPSTKTPPPPPPPSSSEAVDAEMAKWRGLYASRVLFTITEEEKEGAESDGGSARFVVGRARVPGEKGADEEVERPVASDAHAAAAQEEEEADEDKRVVEDPSFHCTPFSTPCASPPFYTPSPSPPRGFEANADTDAWDDEVFSPAEVKLPAGTNPLEASGNGEGKRAALLPVVRPVQASC